MEIVIRLNYLDYKAFEKAMKDPTSERTHSESDPQRFHKSFQLPLGDGQLQIQGPVVSPEHKESRLETEGGGG